jgi:GNAT superfamily N-acetyltransferase
VSAILTDISPAAMVEAIENNLHAACPPIFGAMPGAVLEDRPDMLRYATGLPHPLMNGVCRTRLTAENAAEKIRETIAFFRARNVPMMWWTGPQTRPADIGRCLEAQGLQPGPVMPGMAIDIAAMNAEPAPPGLTLTEVGDAETLRQWVDVCCRGFEMPTMIGEAFAVGSQQVGFGDDKPIRNFLAIRDGAPVACATLALVAGSAGIYCVATVPEARRQGYGGTVVVKALQAARDKDYRIGVLESSEMGESVYKRLGFVEVCKIACYVLK